MFTMYFYIAVTGDEKQFPGALSFRFKRSAVPCGLWHEVHVFCMCLIEMNVFIVLSTKTRSVIKRELGMWREMKSLCALQCRRAVGLKELQWHRQNVWFGKTSSPFTEAALFLFFKNRTLAECSGVWL